MKFVHAFRPFGPLGVLIALPFVSGCGNSVGPMETHAAPPPLTPDFLDDPIEPINRSVGMVNAALLVGVLDPLARVWQGVVPRPARQSIGHFGYNIQWPGRLINQTLQGRWQDAADDSARFLTNTTVGVAGLFDVASRWDIPKPQADFARTFQGWGWKPGTYVMLPVIGPSDDCNTVGTALDTAANPLTYVGDDSLVLPYAVRFNRISADTGRAVRLIRSEADPYSFTKLFWSYAGRIDKPDWTVDGPQDPATMQTLRVAAIKTEDPDFFRKGRTVAATVPATGKKALGTLWLRDEPAPLVYVLPGLGSHRLSMTTLSLAEHLYESGFSVVATTSVFHPEFMERASTSALPAYPPADTADLLAALEAIDSRLARRHPGRFTRRALVGASMGGFHALHLAAHETKRGSDRMVIDRYIAINPPVDLARGARTIDEFHAAPLQWPEETRRERINNILHKVGGLVGPPLDEITQAPFSAIESQYLIGLNFRLTLRDALFSSQSRHDLGVLDTPFSRWSRRHVYQEILSMSYHEYGTRFVFPYYASRGIGVDDFRHHGNLRSFGRELRSQEKARLITNRNDFLLTADDIGWMRGAFGTSRLSVFPDGGHLGNLASPEVRNALLDQLEDLK